MEQNLNELLHNIIEIQTATLQKIANITNGKPGPKGDPGYTPIKGVDYWTQEDKSQLVEQISERLLAEEF